jgi:tRNA A-37 threonylcarbamoyl transferase component Bud32
VETVALERLGRFEREYENTPVDPTYLDIYRREEILPNAFAFIHAGLDAEFKWMNVKARGGHGGHFNADNSRNLLDLIDRIREVRTALDKAGLGLVINPEYERVLDGAAKWLSSSGGSAIPEGFTPIEVESYAPVFQLHDQAVKLDDSRTAKLTQVGEGAFALVHRFTDPNYGLTFARKRLKPGSDQREKERFRREFDLMKDLQFPYVLEVYRFDESDWSYTMEYCDASLEAFVAEKNNQQAFGFLTRKRIALQFLYGLNFIHSRGHLHRDISTRNVLLRTFGGSAVLVKLSDFGLAKQRGSDFTVTETEMKGTKIDPALGSFKEFAAVNDIYAAGFVLLYIFTGRKSVTKGIDPRVERIVQRCIHSQPEQRYQSVKELLADVEALDAPQPEAQRSSAERPRPAAMPQAVQDMFGLIDQAGRKETPA